MRTDSWRAGALPSLFLSGGLVLLGCAEDPAGSAEDAGSEGAVSSPEATGSSSPEPAAAASSGQSTAGSRSPGSSTTAGASMPRPSGPRPNLLLVTLDTTRTDHLGCYGSTQANTPSLDALAARGALFEEAFSPAPMTLPAHATLLTGFLPPQHGARVNGEHRLAEDVPSLAEELSAAGYRTGAFIAAFVLNHRFGLARGFDCYDDDLSGAYEQDVPSGLARYRPGNLVTDSALQWLEAGDADQPFFAWVHLYDAHYPWFSHEDGVEDPAPGSGSYDGEITFADAQLGRLMESLRASGRLENTVVVACADHGEGLGDHGELEHAYLLNEEVLHVPWVIAGPGVQSGHRVSALVSLEDFRPTVNQLLGLPEAELARGRSLVPALQGEGMESGVGYAETDLPWTAYRWSPQRSLTTERWKYIRTPMTELYDRSQDRDELINLAEVEPEIRAQLEAKLSAMEAEMGQRNSEVASLSSGEIEQLAALGYTVGGGGEAPGTAEGQLADVKQRLPAKQLSAQLREGLARDVLDPATRLQMARELVRLSPETPSFHDQLGQALLANGLVQEGLQELNLVVQLVPEAADAWYSLGDALQQNGFTADARPCLEKALELEPKMSNAHVGMGNVQRSEGRPDLAAGSYSKAISLREGDYPEAHFNLALTYLDRGNPEKASEHFLLAAQQKPGWAIAHASLAQLYANWGKGPEALEQYRIALDLAPANVALRMEYGQVLKATGEATAAAEQWRRAAEDAPTLYRPRVLLADLAYAAGKDAEAIAGYEEALKLEPGHPEPYARLARLLAICPDPAFRDGARALALAQRAADLSESSSPQILDTLAAAQAASGDYTSALGTAHQAQQMARERGMTVLAEALDQRIGQYAVQSPFIDSREVEVPGASSDQRP